MEEVLASILDYLEIESRLREISMYRTSTSCILKAIFVIGLFGTLTAETGEERPFPVDVSVFDGQGSLLVQWDFPDTILAAKVSIFVKESGDESFSLMSEMVQETHSYLDLNCLSGERYLYQVKVLDVFGRIFSSDSITPAFGSCLEIDDLKLNELNFSALNDILIHATVGQVEVINDAKNISNIFNLFNLDENTENIWFEQFDLNQINDVKNLMEQIDYAIYDFSFDSYLNERELFFRNRLHLTQNQWEDEVKKGIDAFKSNWNQFYDNYENAVQRLEETAPIRITKIDQSEQGEIQIHLLTFHSDQIHSNEIFLLSGQEYLNVTDFQMDDGGASVVIVPNNWTYVDLMMDDIFIQTCPIIPEQSLVFTLDGDIVPGENKSTVKVSKNPSMLWLNEIAWNAFTKELKIEVAGQTSFQNQYAIQLNGEIIWDIEFPTSFETSFLDSAFTFSAQNHSTYVISIVELIEDISHPLEIIVLDSTPVAISRIPDGEVWHYSESTSLGKTNSLDSDRMQTELLPELFVLYQNYPNPFNGQTRITFDLLEDAIISLYVTDATGRIHNKYLENELLTSGNYNFEWNGEGKSTGIYFFTIQAQSGQLTPTIQSRKMIYLK